MCGQIEESGMERSHVFESQIFKYLGRVSIPRKSQVFLTRSA